MRTRNYNIFFSYFHFQPHFEKGGMICTTSITISSFLVSYACVYFFKFLPCPFHSASASAGASSSVAGGASSSAAGSSLDSSSPFSSTTGGGFKASSLAAISA